MNDFWNLIKRGQTKQLETVITDMATLNNKKLITLLNSTDEDDHTPLMIAALHDYVDMCKLLIRKGANVNGTNSWSDTALHVAARCGRVDVCGTLLIGGAKVNMINKDGETPMYGAWVMMQAKTFNLLKNEDGTMEPIFNGPEATKWGPKILSHFLMLTDKCCVATCSDMWPEKNCFLKVARTWKD